MKQPHSVPAGDDAQPIAWTNAAQLGFLKDPAYAEIPMAMWGKSGGYADIPLYASQPPAAPVETDIADVLSRLRRIVGPISGETQPLMKQAADLIENLTSHPRLSADSLHKALESARGEIVLAIAFLGRDLGTDRLNDTVDSLITRLAKADADARAALTATEPQTLPTRDKIARTLAYEEWPLAMQDERQRWADRNWEKWLRQADAILALSRPDRGVR